MLSLTGLQQRAQTPIVPSCQVGDISVNNALRGDCEGVRQLVEAGDIDAAIRLANSVSPAVLQVLVLHVMSLHEAFPYAGPAACTC